MNNEQVLQDFRRRYEGTFIHVEIQSEKKEVLAKVSTVESNAQKVGVIHLETLDYGLLSVNLGSEGHTLKFKYPPVGVFQNGHIACAFYRKPVKQYRRGLCVENSQITNVARSLGGGNPSFNFDTVTNAFKHENFSVEPALTGLKNGKYRSVAIPDNMSIMLSPLQNTNDYLILHYGQVIASFDPEKRRIKTVFEKVYAPLLQKHFM